MTTALNNVPVTKVTPLRPFTLLIEPESIFLLIQLDGHDAKFFSDAGAGLSIVGKLEAKELDILAEDIDGK